MQSCDKIIDAASYSIEPNFFDNFKILNDGSRENIFVIVENGNAEFDARSIGSMSNKLRLTMLTLHYSQQSTWNMITKPWNGFCARPKFIERYEAYRDWETDRKSTRLNSSHSGESRMPSSA